MILRGMVISTAFRMKTSVHLQLNSLWCGRELHSLHSLPRVRSRRAPARTTSGMIQQHTDAKTLPRRFQSSAAAACL
jgi:hypothetical protein